MNGNMQYCWFSILTGVSWNKLLRGIAWFDRFDRILTEQGLICEEAEQIGFQISLNEFQVRTVWGTHVTLDYSSLASKDNAGFLSALCRHDAWLASSSKKERSEFMKFHMRIFIDISSRNVKLLESKSSLVHVLATKFKESTWFL